MPNGLSLSQVCGQLIVGGFPSPEIPAELRAELRSGTRGGIIVFKRNLPSIEAARSISAQALEACPPELPPFVSVDQEGGRVGRLPPPFLKLPPMRRLGSSCDAALVEEVACVLGLELAALGFNLDFAPVLDVDSNPDNPVIGDRAFSDDPKRVSELAGAFIRGLQSAGLLACGKHFPGHGDTEKDSHFDLPVVSHPEARLREVELPPFAAACREGVATLMSAHVVYQGLDRDVPATLSSRICSELLRSELGFSGVLFSDDLEMKALSDRMSAAESAVAAIRAGCDALLVCSDLALQARAHEALLHEAEKDSAFRARCEQAAERGLVARRRCPPRPLTEAEVRQQVGTTRARELEARLAELGVG